MSERPIQHVIIALVDAIYGEEPQPTGHVRAKILDAMCIAQNIRDFGPGGRCESEEKLEAAMRRQGCG